MSRLWAGIIVAFASVILPTVIALIDNLCVGCERKRVRATGERINAELGEMSGKASSMEEIADRFSALAFASAIDFTTDSDSSDEPEDSESGELHARNCPNCGAPVRGGECEYCGTVFTPSNDVSVVLDVDVDAVASAVRRYNDSAGRTVRHFNQKTHQWEWVAENPDRLVRTPPLPTKHGRW